MTDDRGFAMQLRFTARSGHGEALAAVLLEAADGLAGVDACRRYLVSRSANDAEAVWCARRCREWLAAPNSTKPALRVTPRRAG